LKERRSPLNKSEARVDKGEAPFAEGAEPASEMPFFAPYLASEGLLRVKGYSDSPPPLRPPSEAKYGASPNSFSLATARRPLRKQGLALQSGCACFPMEPFPLRRRLRGRRRFCPHPPTPVGVCPPPPSRGEGEGGQGGEGEGHICSFQSLFLRSHIPAPLLFLCPP